MLFISQNLEGTLVSSIQDTTPMIGASTRSDENIESNTQCNSSLGHDVIKCILHREN